MDSLNPIVEHIYHAALDASIWPETVVSIQSQFQGNASGIYSVTKNRQFDGALIPLHLQGIEESYQSTYIDYFMYNNPWADLTRLQAVGFVRTDRTLDQHLRSPGYYQRTELYNEWMRPQDFIHTLGVNLFDQANVRTKCFIYRPKASKAFTSGEIGRFSALSRHMTLALQVANRLARQDFRLQTAMQVIEQLNFGVIFLDGLLRVKAANRFAQALLDGHDGVRLSNGKLVSAHRDDRRRLDTAVNLAVSLHLGKSVDAPPRIFLQRPEGKRPLSLLSLPVSRHVDSGFFGASDAVVLFITDPELEPVVSEEWLQQRYGLTVAESRLTRLLVQGRTLRNSAEVVGITYQTARSYLKLILQKTGSARQLELVRNLLSEQAFLHFD